MRDKRSSIIFSRGNIYTKRVALTYDCGLEKGYAEEILDVLKRHKVLATFFLTGLWAEHNAGISRRIINEGHEIGNHSYDHADLTGLTWEGLIKQIFHADLSIYRATGKLAHPLFRLPYGSYSRQVLDTLGDWGYKYCIHWSLDTLDYRQRTAWSIADQILQKVRNGDITHMHVMGRGTAEASDLVVTELKKQGYELVTVGSMLSAKERTVPELTKKLGDN